MAKPDIEFVDEPDLVIEDERARKFCPACGRGILVEAKKCRHCGAWVEEAARREAQARPAGGAAVAVDYIPHFLFSFMAYFVFWLPGVVLNWHFLSEARRLERATGVRPHGTFALETMLWIGTILPLAFIAMTLASGVLRMLLR